MAKILKYVTSEGTEETLNHSTTNLDDSVISGVKSWSSSNIVNFVESVRQALVTLISTKASNADLTARVDEINVSISNVNTAKADKTALGDQVTYSLSGDVLTITRK